MPPSHAAHMREPVTEADHVRGSLSAPALLVEYADFDCPFCQAAVATLSQLHTRLEERMALVVRYFPLDSHVNGRRAAHAAEAAGRQGRFWEMHDRLFAHPTALGEESLPGHAAAIGLDVDRFNADRHSAEVEKRVQRDVSGGGRSGVHGTPTFFINGHRHDGDAHTQLIEAIAAALGL